MIFGVSLTVAAAAGEAAAGFDWQKPLGWGTVVVVLVALATRKLMFPREVDAYEARAVAAEARATKAELDAELWRDAFDKMTEALRQSERANDHMMRQESVALRLVDALPKVHGGS